MSGQFEILGTEHTDRLLAFESANRRWFESLIAARPDAFYSHGGVTAHIDECRDFFSAGRLVPLVLCDGESIIARANLKDISSQGQSAEVGYRVAEDYFGQGVASACLRQLVNVARERIDGCRLWGRVLDNNPASRRVLEKQRFSQVAYQPAFAEIRGHVLGCTVMERRLGDV